MRDQQIVAVVRQWLQRMVIGLNLCPFAQREFKADRLRFAVTHATSEHALLEALAAEFEMLSREPEIETTLLIHPDVLQDFADYNQFLDLADGLLATMGLVGELQVASFHPDYLFADADLLDAQNFRCRSPFPLLHVLREATLQRDIDKTPDIDTIPERNIDALRELGIARLQALLAECKLPR